MVLFVKQTQRAMNHAITMNKFRKIGFLRPIATLFLLVLLLTLPADPRELDLGPQQTVQTINPKMGIHTRLTDEVEPWKIQRTLQMVREMGTPWIVEYFPWAYREPSAGYFDWSHSDLVIEHANQQGLTVIGRLGFVPEWARPEDSASSYLPPERYDDFGRYVRAFVERYGEQVPIIIIWNEPNLALEWGFQPVDPEGYTELLRVAYQQAKQADERVIVLGGALAPTLAPPGDAQGMDDLIYLERMLNVGAGEVMDGLSVHAYGWVFPADDPPDPQVVNFRRIELVRQLLVEHDHADLPIYVTEGGWNDHPRWTKAVKPGQRIENTIRAYQLAEEWPWLKVMGLWAFRYPWSSKTYLDYFTFVTPDFEPKPIYLEVQEYATKG
ncbi:beta-galactosidase [Anaerolineales bacterium HSG24]|nr:beta-galactosidase [Anaerolineales bacterium HSG24]